MFIPEAQLDQLDRLAVHTELTISEHVRRAIDAYLEREEKKGKATMHLTTPVGRRKREA